MAGMLSNDWKKDEIVNTSNCELGLINVGPAALLAKTSFRFLAASRSSWALHHAVAGSSPPMRV